MERITVDSSNIISIGYDELKKVLEIEFKNGIYQYLNFSKEVYEKFIDASSKGSFFHRFIRDKYSTIKIK